MFSQRNKTSGNIPLCNMLGKKYCPLIKATPCVMQRPHSTPNHDRATKKNSHTKDISVCDLAYANVNVSYYFGVRIGILQKLGAVL